MPDPLNLTAPTVAFRSAFVSFSASSVMAALLLSLPWRHHLGGMSNTRMRTRDLAEMVIGDRVHGHPAVAGGVDAQLR